jgi:hypothetical protein
MYAVLQFHENGKFVTLRAKFVGPKDLTFASSKQQVRTGVLRADR